jgi:hypothetical protein
MGDSTSQPENGGFQNAVKNLEETVKRLQQISDALGKGLQIVVLSKTCVLSIMVGLVLIWAFLFYKMIVSDKVQTLLTKCPWVIGAILLLSPTIALALVIWAITKVSHME